MQKAEKRPGESDSAGNKRAILDRRNRMTEIEGERKLRRENKLKLAKTRERVRARRAASSKKIAAEHEIPENRVARLDRMKTQKEQYLESEALEERWLG